jgi:hypothetical protein
MKDLEEKHGKQIETVQKTSIQDKNDFMQDTNVRRNEEIFELKRNFGKVMDATVTDYEMRLDNYKRDNDNLKAGFEQKLRQIMDNSDKQMVTQKKIYEDKRTADQKSYQLLMDQRENDLKKRINELNSSYQRKIDNLVSENDRRMKSVTGEYESRLKELASSKAAELNQKDAKGLNELERVKAAYDDEKARIINQYENQINQMRIAHRDQMEEMKNFKSLA